MNAPEPTLKPAARSLVHWLAEILHLEYLEDGETQSDAGSDLHALLDREAARDLD